MTQTLPSQHTPPLGFKVLTPLYDSAIALLTRERRWRSDFVDAINPQAEDIIVDVGSGTGSLAMAILSREPKSIYLGVDPDADAIVRATKKIKEQSLTADFVHGYLEPDLFAKSDTPVKIVSSLVLHQVPLAEKSRILATMYDILQPGGLCHIADYGRQRSWLSKLMFRLTVQLLDGVEDTQPNADGVLPDLMRAAGFLDVLETRRITTPTGVISLYQGTKSYALSGAVK